MNNEFFIRNSHEYDASLIYSSWLGGSKPKYASWEVHRDYQSKIITLLLASGAKVRLAVNPEDTNQIFGWICYENVDGIPLIHWVYTKSIYRRRGLAKALLKDVGVDFKTPILATTSSYICDRLRDKYEVMVIPHLLNRS